MHADDRGVWGGDKMTNFQPDNRNNIHRGSAKISGGVANGRNAWILPGGRITHSKEEAERAAMVVKRIMERWGE